jgi:hypothetical protein
MKLVILRTRVVGRLNERIRNGELTERGLARMTGVSQPHMHNVLKGTRALSPEMADQILERLGMTVLDLFDSDDWNAIRIRMSAVPDGQLRPRPTW